MSVRDDLLRAYALIQDERAWCQGRSRSDRGRRCVSAAIMTATASAAYAQLNNTRRTAEAACLALFGTQMLWIINDTQGHRAALMVLRHAILKEEGLA